MSQQGWECPRCGTVYAPWQPKCTTCAHCSAAVAVTSHCSRCGYPKGQHGPNCPAPLENKRLRATLRVDGPSLEPPVGSVSTPAEGE